MADSYPIICDLKLRRLLRTVAEESLRETERYCRVLANGSEHCHGVRSLHEEALALIAARVTQNAWDLLPAPEPDTMAPIAWSIQEMTEWASHLVRLERLADTECRAPLTWLPKGDYPLGTRDVATAVEERLALLRHELRDHGVLVMTSQAEEVAA